VAAAVSAALVAGCFSPNFGEGQYHCGGDFRSPGACPPGYRCENGLCVTGNGGPTTDLGPADAPARQDVSQTSDVPVGQDVHPGTDPLPPDSGADHGTGSDAPPLDVPTPKDVAGTDTAPDMVVVPEGMVLVPGTTYTMGCNTAVDTSCAADERPAHDVKVSSFFIDRQLVTVGQYAACVQSSGCTANVDDMNLADDIPVAHITFDQAAAYCRAAGKRLPTEAEFELAVRGTDGRIFPWGNDTPACGQLANLNNCVGARTPVGMFTDGVSPFGVLDGSGNLFEWISDFYDAAFYSTPDAVRPDPKGPATGTTRVIRGGAFSSAVANGRCSNRFNLDPTNTAPGQLVGFRCVRPAP
jgi:formylglycine-generating enzyme required for sulfatase activity